MIPRVRVRVRVRFRFRVLAQHLGNRPELEGELDYDAEGALTADEELGQVVPGRTLAHATAVSE